MDKSKKIILIIVAIVVAIGLGVKACSNKIGDLVADWVTPNMNYDNADRFTSASQGCLPNTIKDINVAWINGSITVKYAQQDSVSWKETFVSGKSDSTTMLHYWIDGHTLYVNFCAANKDVGGKKEGWHMSLKKQTERMRHLCKDLEIILPQDWMLDQLIIHNVNGSITTQTDAQKIELGSVNGEKTVWAHRVSQIKMSTVNGSSWIHLPEQTDWQAEFDKVNGNFSSDFSFEKEDDSYTHGQAPFVNIEVESVNGSLEIRKI